MLLIHLFWLICRFVPGGPPAGTRPVPNQPLPQPTRDIAAIKVTAYTVVTAG